MITVVHMGKHFNLIPSCSFDLLHTFGSSKEKLSLCRPDINKDDVGICRAAGRDFYSITAIGNQIKE